MIPQVITPVITPVITQVIPQVDFRLHVHKLVQSCTVLSQLVLRMILSHVKHIKQLQIYKERLPHEVFLFLHIVCGLAEYDRPVLIK